MEGAAPSWALRATIFGGLVLLYALTSPRGVGLEDDGLFAMAANTAGVAHPPGYPLYGLLGFIWVHLPGVSPIFGLHLFSAVLGAAACLVLFELLDGLGVRRPLAAAAALSLGVSRTFWSQSIVSEVYTLNALLLFALLFVAARMAAGREHPRDPLILGALAGLALANHWPLALLTAPGIAWVLWPARRHLGAHRWRVLAGLAAGASPYLWMVGRSLMDPDGSFYGPIRSPGDLAFIVSRAGYAAVDSSATSGAADRAGFGQFVTTQLVSQLSVIGAALAAAGLVAVTRRSRELGVALVVIVLGNTAALVALLGFDHDHLGRQIFRVYPMVAYGALTVGFGFGLDALAQRLDTRWPRRGVLMVTAVAAVHGAALLVLNLPHNHRADYVWGERFGRAILESLPEDAILFVAGDTNVGPIGYLNRVEGVRPDVDVYHFYGRVFANRLYSELSDPTLKGRPEAIAALLASTDRPVFHTPELGAPFPGSHGERLYGPYVEVLRNTPGAREARAHPALMRLYDAIVDERPTDGWTRQHRHLLVKGFIDVLLRLGRGEGATPEMQSRLQKAAETFYGGLGLLQVVVQSGTDAELQRMGRWVREVRPVETASKRHRAVFHLLSGHLHFRRGDPTAAFAAWERGRALDPSVDRLAISMVLDAMGLPMSAFGQLKAQLSFDEGRAQKVARGRYLQRQTVTGAEGRPVDVTFAWRVGGGGPDLVTGITTHRR